MNKRRKTGLLWISMAAGLVCGVTAGVFLGLTHDLPQIQALENFKPSAVTRVYSSEHIVLAELFLERRDPVPLEQIPAALKTALLTTEDRGFYQHSGIAVKGIIRAILMNFRSGRFAQGASTLTQQLAKTLFLSPRKTIVRKMREAILALQLERRYTKDEILELYLNQIYFGSGAYGVASAARIYFGKKIQDLTLTECALVAGLPKAPSAYSPLVNPELARKRRNIVLFQMFSTGAIDESTYHEAIQSPVVTRKPDRIKKAPYFIDYIKSMLELEIGADRIYKGGLSVYTTLSYHLQTAAESALTDGLDRLANRMQLDLGAQTGPQGALIAMDMATVGIVSMVGGKPSSTDSFNRAINANRQPGSAFKPIIYALALEKGFDQNDPILDAPIAFKLNSLDEDWQPENFSGAYEGEISLYWALTQSKNIPAIRLLEQLGPSSAVQFAHSLGIDSDLAANLSLALGTSEVSLLEMTAAYAVFGNRGKYIRPYGLIEVRDSRGHIIWRTKPEQRIVMSRTSAAIMTNMLEGVIQHGTGRKAGVLPGSLAGKTGTTNDSKDALFIGFSPTLAAGVWVGNDDASILGPNETGARAALPIWIQFMQAALSHQENVYFDIPDDVTQTYIHARTGKKVDADSSQAIRVLLRKPLSD